MKEEQHLLTKRAVIILTRSNRGREAMSGQNNEADNGDGSPSLVRASKRRRCSSSGNDAAAAVNNNGDDTTIEKLTLPPEMWADVMKYLPFDNILSCCAVSRNMLHETMPLLTKIQIDKAAQMNLAVASRFRDVTDIHINSLLLREIHNEGMWDDEITEATFDFDSRIRVLPFLFCFMKTLERVHFGAKDNRGNVIEGFSPANAYFWEESEFGYPDDPSRDLMMAFIDSLSGAFICGAFPKHLQISGLCCPDINSYFFGRGSRHRQCATCIRACKSFPLESVATSFHSDGSSSGNALAGRAFGLDVCLPMTQIESIVESRPGGRELLLSDERLFRLLGSGRRWEVGDDDSAKLVFVKYKKTQLDEMKRIIAYAGLDAKKLPTDKLHEAVLNSFHKGTVLPRKSQRYLSEQSLLCLKDEVNLCIDVTDICGSTLELRQSLKSVAQGLVQYYNEDVSFNIFEYYEEILGDCITFIRRSLEVEVELEQDKPIQDVLSSAIPCLTKALDGNNGEDPIEVASCLGMIYAKGSEEQRKIIIDAGAISKFIRLLESSEESITKIALSGLVDILADEKKEHVEAMVQAGGVPKLVEMLRLSDDLLSKGSQRLLVIAANDHIEKVIDAKAHEGLFRIILSDVQTESFPKCSILLRKIFEVDNPPIQQAVNANLIPRLVEILSTAEDEVVQTNLASVCIALASGVNEDNIDALMRETGLLPLLVDLQNSPLDTVPERAITCLEHISKIRSSFDAESGEALAWGEYRILDLVDSDDDESSVSCEEALEVSDEEVALEEQQAEAGDEPSFIYEAIYSRNRQKKKPPAIAPSLLGVPEKLFRTISCYMTESEISMLPSVCREFRLRIETRNIRKMQLCCDNEIMEILCGQNEVDELALLGASIADGIPVMHSEQLHNLAADIMARMNCEGTTPSFRLRGDTVDYLFELLQGYMIRRLQNALLMATHDHRAEVQRQDFLLLPSQEMQSKCNVEDNYHVIEGDNISSACSCSLPSSSGIVWRWPENDCRDVWHPDIAHRIIRRLAYKAGIIEMTRDFFVLAEAELLHTLGILLVEAYESSVEMAKHAQFLGPNEVLLYGHSPDSMDMFFKPPPPFCKPSDEDTGKDLEIETTQSVYTYTIVPGQIRAAAEKRGFGPNKVYGHFYYDQGREEEIEIEKRFYYQDEYFEDECVDKSWCDCDCMFECDCKEAEDEPQDSDTNESRSSESSNRHNELAENNAGVATANVAAAAPGVAPTNVVVAAPPGAPQPARLSEDNDGLGLGCSVS